MKPLISFAVVIMIFFITGCAVTPQILPERDAADGEPDIADTAELGIVRDIDIDISKKPMIALTFDDGPDEYTDSILDILERYGGRATFFVLGELVEERPDTVKRAVKNGNEIAGHTWSHRQLTALNNTDIAESIQSTSKIIEQITGIPRPFFYRPPYGLVNRRVANVSAELGYAIVNWTVDIQDWRLLNADLVYNAVMMKAKEGSIILLHDIFPSTAEAAKRLIPALISKGFQLVTVSELLYRSHGSLVPGRVYGNPGIVFP